MSNRLGRSCRFGGKFKFGYGFGGRFKFGYGFGGRFKFGYGFGGKFKFGYGFKGRFGLGYGFRGQFRLGEGRRFGFELRFWQNLCGGNKELFKWNRFLRFRCQDLLYDFRGFSLFFKFGLWCCRFNDRRFSWCFNFRFRRWCFGFYQVIKTKPGPGFFRSGLGLLDLNFGDGQFFRGLGFDRFNGSAKDCLLEDFNGLRNYGFGKQVRNREGSWTLFKSG
jgi:hypothetical protein